MHPQEFIDSHEGGNPIDTYTHEQYQKKQHAYRLKILNAENLSKLLLDEINDDCKKNVCNHCCIEAVQNAFV